MWAERRNFQARSQEATVGFAMSIGVPVHMEHLVSNWTGLAFNPYRTNVENRVSS